MALKILGKVNARTRHLARRACLLDLESLKLGQCTFGRFETGTSSTSKKLVRVAPELEHRSHVGKSQFF